MTVLPIAQNVTIEVILRAVLGVADPDMRRRFRRLIDDTLFYPLGAFRLRLGGPARTGSPGGGGPRGRGIRSRAALTGGVDVLP